MPGVNLKKGERPRVRKLGTLLHPEQSHRVKGGYVEIWGIRLKIIGHDSRDDGCGNRDKACI